MLKAEIKKYLSQYKNVLEIINHANELKRNGESEIMVNRVVAELRKELLTATADIKRIPKREIADTDIQRVGSLSFAVDSLESPIVVWDRESILI